MPRIAITGIVPAVLLLLSAPASGAGEPRVAGLTELVISDPSTHEAGLPAVRFEPRADGKSLAVEIPAKVHTHRFYFSGDKEFQGPFVAGGPTIVVAAQPKTGERMYIDVVLPAGYPVIVHDKNSITYVYPDRRVEIRFPFLCRDKAVVSYLPGKGAGRQMSEALAQAKEKTQKALKRSEFVGSVCAGAEEARDVLAGSWGMVAKAGTVAVDTTRKVVQRVPGIQTLQSLGGQGGERRSLEEVRQAGNRQVREVEEFVPTNR